MPGALHQGFKTLEEAKEWYSKNRNVETTSSKNKGTRQTKEARSKNSDTSTKSPSKLRKVVFYTDGGSINNPGFPNSCNEDNCPAIFNPLQKDTYPPQGNSIRDACECEGDFNCDGSVDNMDLKQANLGRSQHNNPCPPL